jgi:glycosyltransferase involved in cell wall biosynthesis
MRVVYVTTLWGGGPISHLRHIVPHVTRAGIETKVLCTDEQVADGFRAVGIDTALGPLRSKLDVGGAWALRAEARAADVVHTHDRRAGLLLRPLARALGTAVVHTYHGLPEPIAVRVGRSDAPPIADTSRLRAAWLLHGYIGIEALLSRLGLVVVPSNALCRFLVEHGIPEGRVRRIPYGIDVLRADPVPAGNPFVVGTAAILHHLKGLDILIEACARVPEPISLRVVGWGPLQAELERRAAELGVQAEFVGRVEDARGEMARFDAFVLPSRGENLPVSILEAMALAVPVIASRVGGVPELLDEGRAGVLVPPEDPAALAEAITELVRNPDRRMAIAREGARRAAQHFDAGDVSRQLVTVYEELMRSA